MIAGNGLSIAFTRDLLLNRITEQLVEEFENLAEDGSDVLAALRKLAERIEDDGAIDESDFEQLVGSFESQAALLEDLSSLASILPEGGTTLPAAIDEVREFTRKLLTRGTGIVLKTILEASGCYSESAAKIQDLFRAMDSFFDGTVTFANLNYDILVLRTLLEIRVSMCDMGLGYGTATFVISDEDGSELSRYRGKPLRTSLNFPPRSKFRLVHPHGSLTYWKNSNTGLVAKVDVDVLRNHDLFSNLVESSGNVMPAVVLANSREKPNRVQEYPFSLAYEAMSAGLDDSDHWLIVGYSFRDESVNNALRTALSKKKKKPKILVSTFGDDLTMELVIGAIGWEGPAIQNIFIDRDGVEGLEQRWGWGVFNF